MTQITEATFEGGVLRRDHPLDVRDRERVRMIVQSIQPASPANRADAMRRLREGIAKMGFRSSNGANPFREELHHR